MKNDILIQLDFGHGTWHTVLEFSSQESYQSVDASSYAEKMSLCIGRSNVRICVDSDEAMDAMKNFTDLQLVPRY